MTENGNACQAIPLPILVARGWLVNKDEAIKMDPHAGDIGAHSLRVLAGFFAARGKNPFMVLRALLN